MAKDLGLAPSTVSKALNNSGNISDKTRKRVLAYVNKVGYVPNSSARILKSKRSYLVGLIYSDISLEGLEHPFFAGILQAFNTTLQENGYETAFAATKIGNRHLSYLEWCRNKQVDGVLIVTGNINNPMIKELVKSEIPCVSTDILMNKLTTIISDNNQGINLAIDYAKKHYNHIAYLSGPHTSYAFNERLIQFEQVMGNRPIEVCGVFMIEDALKATHQLLEHHHIDCLICGSDILAIGAIQALNSKGLRVPEDVAIIGFDDINVAGLYSPSLTTIRQDRRKIGTLAAQQLISMIETQKKVKKVIRVPVHLIIRNSTK